MYSSFRGAAPGRIDIAVVRSEEDSKDSSREEGKTRLGAVIFPGERCEIGEDDDDVPSEDSVGGFSRCLYMYRWNSVGCKAGMSEHGDDGGCFGSCVYNVTM